MARSEQEMIDALFSRLKEAEQQTGERDANAQARIDAHVQDQPGAPYYMAQTILIQEAAIKRLNARVEALEQEKNEKRSSGGFLAGIFGGGGQPERSQSQRPRSSMSQPAGQRFGQNTHQSAGPGQSWQTNGPAGPASGNAMRGGSGFLGGALQTAAGVAGGMMLGNMLMGMFGQHGSEEIANVIEDPVGTDHEADGQADIADTGGWGADRGDQGGLEQTDYSPDADTSMDNGGFQDDPFRDGNFDEGGGFDDFDEI